jgi:hypothetical protein
VEGRAGKMATANRLVFLQKIKQEEGVLSGSFFNTFTPMPSNMTV